jgi:hypothetical protein
VKSAEYAKFTCPAIEPTDGVCAAGRWVTVPLRRPDSMVTEMPAEIDGLESAFNADSRMFAAELRRGTPAGPDVARLGNYLSAECALMVATAFAREMVIASEIGDDAWKDRIRAKITYATPR